MTTAAYVNAAAAAVHASGFVELPLIYLSLTLVGRMLDQQEVLRNPWRCGVVRVHIHEYLAHNQHIFWVTFGSIKSDSKPFQSQMIMRPRKIHADLRLDIRKLRKSAH